MCSPQNASAVIADSRAIEGLFAVFTSVRSNLVPVGQSPARLRRRFAPRNDRKLSAGPKAGQAAALVARGVEIARVEPGLERGAQCRPVAVDDRVPRGVAVSAAGDL